MRSTAAASRENSGPSPTEQAFTRVDEDQAADIVDDVFGRSVIARPARLATERDDTFRVRDAEGQYIFKIAHPAEDRQVINLQTAALEHAAARDPRLPLQTVVPTPDGRKEPVITSGGDRRIARLLTYLPGELLRTSTPTADQLRKCGLAQARLASALADFDHPVADRHVSFDVKNFAELRDVAATLDHPDVTRAFTWYDEVLAPRADELPTQVLHTDFGLDNVLVDSSDDAFVVGILDFGDVVRTWRVADLASGLASQVSIDGPAWERPAHMLEGYQSVIPLHTGERDLLAGIVALRIAQRILMGERLSATLPGNVAYLRRNLDLSYRQLNNLHY